MRTHATAAVVAVLALTLGACSGDSDTDTDDKPRPSASASLDQAAARQACVDAWLTQLEDGTASADNEPSVCDQVPGQSAAMYAEALQKNNEANRERMDECLEDSACTELPVP